MNTTAQNFLGKKSLITHQENSLYHCYGYGCASKTLIHFNNEQWQIIDSFFQSLPNSPEAERDAIRDAIGTFETIVGDIAKTDNDKSGTFVNLNATNSRQHDCIDESYNTSIYLNALYDRGNLKFHIPLAPTSRVPIIHGGPWPHQTAVIQDIQTGEKFAIDSWWHDNGTAPEVVNLKTWKDAWSPNKE